MIERPRLGLAASGAGPEPSFAAMALLSGLSHRNLKTQHFRCRACPTGAEVVLQLTGLPVRHLDAWLMPADVCRRSFVRGTSWADIGIVEGTGAAARPWVNYQDFGRPGELGPIAEFLDLPKVAVITCPSLEGMHLPSIPAGTDAILIDGLERAEDFEAISSFIRFTLRKPVIGAVEALPMLRASLNEVSRDQMIPVEAVHALNASIQKFLDLPTLLSLANSRAFPACGCDAAPCDEPPARFRVAYARDAIFGGYFPDTLETLEALGAELEPFSPLKRGLPADVDLVLIGCGHPEKALEELSANTCLIAELRNHVCKGRRIYAEGGGAAYLGQSIRVEGEVYPGVGLLPFEAELLPNPRLPYPVTRKLMRDVWLGSQGTEVRGYHSGRWRLSPRKIESHGDNCFGPLTDVRDLWFHHHVVGSLVHLHLASLPDVVKAFAGPHRPSLTLPRLHY